MTLESKFAAAQKQQLPFHAPVGVRVAPHSAFALAVGQAVGDLRGVFRADQLEFIEAKQNMGMPFRYVFQSVRRAEPTLNKTILGAAAPEAAGDHQAGGLSRGGVGHQMKAAALFAHEVEQWRRRRACHRKQEQRVLRTVAAHILAPLSESAQCPQVVPRSEEHTSELQSPMYLVW